MFVKVETTKQREIIVNVDHITSIHPPNFANDSSWGLCLIDFESAISITQASATALINLLKPVPTIPDPIAAQLSAQVDAAAQLTTQLIRLLEEDTDEWNLAVSLQNKIAEIPS